LAKFGLIPSLAKDEKISRHTYNARSETAAEKPSCPTAWIQSQYGLVLFDNFYEPSYESGRAVRWRIALASGDPWIAFLRKRWTHPASCELVVSFTMLTVNAEERPVMRQFHKPVDERRTPVIIAPDLHDAWLSADTAKAPELMTFLPWYGRRELARKWLCEASIYGATCKKVARAVV
jgi:putative SOS response-associated peptidase YedK